MAHDDLLGQWLAGSISLLSAKPIKFLWPPILVLQFGETLLPVIATVLHLLLLAVRTITTGAAAALIDGNGPVAINDQEMMGQEGCPQRAILGAQVTN